MMSDDMDGMNTDTPDDAQGMEDRANMETIDQTAPGGATLPGDERLPNQTPEKPEKASYERSPDVQRWLREHAVEDGTKPEFSPTFLAHQRDRFWVLSSLAHFYEADLISDVLSVVKSGKEATVYCCAAHPATGARYLAAKVYRPRMFRSLRNDAIYRENRAMRDEWGREVYGRRRSREAARSGEHIRAAQITSWLAYEFETQRLLHAAGADVPRPLSQ